MTATLNTPRLHFIGSAARSLVLAGMEKTGKLGAGGK
jgi:hypothetical protein